MPHRRPLAAFAGAVALGAALLAGTPADAGDTPTEPSAVAVLPANEAEKAKAFDALAVATAEKSVEKLLEALRLMTERKHLDYSPEVRKHLSHDDPRVQAAAIAAAASQDLKDVEKDVRRILKAKPKKGGPGTLPGAVAAACIDYLGRMGIAGEETTVLDEQLKMLVGDERRLKQPWAREMFRASLHYFGKTKWKPAVPYLIEELVAEPVPANPNDPKNPPASYWQARHKLWEDYEGWARWALREITGQEFRSVREWQAWFRQQDKKAYK